MPIILCSVATHKKEKLVPILKDADEGEERIRIALMDEGYTSLRWIVRDVLEL